MDNQLVTAERVLGPLPMFQFICGGIMAAVGVWLMANALLKTLAVYLREVH